LSDFPTEPAEQFSTHETKRSLVMPTRLSWTILYLAFVGTRINRTVPFQSFTKRRPA